MSWLLGKVKNTLKEICNTVNSHFLNKNTDTSQQVAEVSTIAD